VLLLQQSLGSVGSIVEYNREGKGKQINHNQLGRRSSSCEALASLAPISLFGWDKCLLSSQVGQFANKIDMDVNLHLFANLIRAY
jgi:hypothetical protein